MKKKFIGLFSLMAVAVMSLVIFSCSSKKIYSFNNPDEAMKVCREKLTELKHIQKCDIDDLSDIIKDWTYLRDSSYICLARSIPTESTENSNLALDYFKLTDSIRTEITRIATSEKRSMKDIVDLKIQSSIARDTTLNKKTYEDAVSLFESFDNTNLITNKDELLKGYKKLLTSDKNVLSNSNKISNFHKEEDRYFRSWLNMILQIPNEDLQYITEETINLFQNLNDRIEKTNGQLNEYLSTILNMRFNRRIIQNAKTCVDNINRGANLNEEQKSNFRWMLIQPFTVLDERLVSVLTKDQIKDLQEIGEDFPAILSKIEGNDNDQDRASKLSDILCSYFLKYYLKTTL